MVSFLVRSLKVEDLHQVFDPSPQIGTHMPTKRYPLESGGPERLEITWGVVRWTPCTITLDGTVIATFPSGKLAKEQSVRLPDGSWLTAQLPGMTTLVVKRNGALLPGSRRAISQVAVQYALTFGALGVVALAAGLGVGIAMIVGGMPAGINQYVEGALFVFGGLLVAGASFFIARGLLHVQKWARVPAAILIGALELFLLVGLLLSGNLLILIGMILIAIPVFQLFSSEEFNSPAPPAS